MAVSRRRRRGHRAAPTLIFRRSGVMAAAQLWAGVAIRGDCLHGAPAGSVEATSPAAAAADEQRVRQRGCNNPARDCGRPARRQPARSGRQSSPRPPNPPQLPQTRGRGPAALPCPQSWLRGWGQPGGPRGRVPPPFAPTEPLRWRCRAKPVAAVLRLCAVLQPGGARLMGSAEDANN